MTEFTCGNCNKPVPAHEWRNHNHCPFCFWSKHVTAEEPCDGLMKPLHIERGIRVKHSCTSCGQIAIAEDWPNAFGAHRERMDRRFRIPQSEYVLAGE